MTSDRRRFVGVITLATALLIATGGSAAAAPPPGRPTAATAQHLITGRAPAGIFWNDPGGHPVGACAPFNDGAEVTTLVFIPDPFPIGILVGWVCNGATGTWTRR